MSSLDQAEVHLSEKPVQTEVDKLAIMVTAAKYNQTQIAMEDLVTRTKFLSLDTGPNFSSLVSCHPLHDDLCNHFSRLELEGKYPQSTTKTVRKGKTLKKATQKF